MNKNSKHTLQLRNYLQTWNRKKNHGHLGSILVKLIILIKNP